MKLNGWQRMWVVAVILMGCFAGYEILDNLPDKQDIEWRYNAALKELTYERIAERRAEEKQARKDWEEAAPGSWDRKIAAGKLGNAKSNLTIEGEISTGKLEAMQQYQAGIDELPDRQKEVIIGGVIAWILASIGLYLAGWTIGWIIRGFRKPKQA
nr:hypothetical protein [uncultured Pseudomonas sp.]